MFHVSAYQRDHMMKNLPRVGVGSTLNKDSRPFKLVMEKTQTSYQAALAQWQSKGKDVVWYLRYSGSDAFRQLMLMHEFEAFMSLDVLAPSYDAVLSQTRGRTTQITSQPQDGPSNMDLTAQDTVHPVLPISITSLMSTPLDPMMARRVVTESRFKVFVDTVAAGNATSEQYRAFTQQFPDSALSAYGKFLAKSTVAQAASLVPLQLQAQHQTHATNRTLDDTNTQPVTNGVTSGGSLVIQAETLLKKCHEEKSLEFLRNT